jgi:RNA polymerase sigma-70 factor (ECF subfamily)
VACQVQNSADVFDIVQDAFLEALRHLDRFDPKKDFGAWLRGICRNRVRNHFRERRTRRNADLTRVDEALESRLTATAFRPDEAMERIEALRKCLQDLPDERRALVTHRYRTGTAIREIAEKLGRTSDAVSKMLGRIRAALMKCVARRLGKTEHEA